LRQEAPISRLYHSLFLAAFLCAAAGCAPQPGLSPQISVEPVEFKTLEGWRSDQLADALAAFRKSCVVLLRTPNADKNKPLLVAGRAVDWRPACNAASTVDEKNSGAARNYFEKWFSPYAVLDRNGDREGLLTGYYEAELRGARQPGGRYKFPLYGRPGDLITADLGRFDAALTGRRVTGRVSNGTLLPYPDRKSIDTGREPKKLKALVWVDSAIDAFFLHIQGSGRVQLAEGGLMRLGYAASNGLAYTAIGRTLIQRGAIARERVSMQTIRAWLAANPEKAPEIMAQNARYIFFRELDGNAPVGAQGVELTAGRSLAVDRRSLPLGAPLWVDTQDPIDPHQPYRRLLIAQDAGHAIKGGIRGDIYFGHGQLAARQAGLMNQRGRYYILLPKAAPPAS
jgi:membrane-bound lytic murein transglycosylase A